MLEPNPINLDRIRRPCGEGPCAWRRRTRSGCSRAVGRQEQEFGAGGARSVRIRFHAARGGCQLRSYRVEPENVPLPAALTERLRALAHAAINESLPRPRHRGRSGDLTWTMESDLMEIRY